MSEGMSERLQALIDEFADAEPRERLELLLDFSDKLPPLEEPYRAQRDAGMNRIHECQTPVFLWIDLVDSRVRIVGDVAPEAPTVKGFVQLLIEACQGATPAEIRALPPDIVRRLGLLEALGMQRSRGLQGIVARIAREVAKLTGEGSSA